MTKTISIYAAQILLGLIAIAAGYAKLSGAGVMVDHLHAIGLGPGFLMVAGTCEIAAGLCLLLPRGGVVGAFLLACVTVGALGVSLGHVASATAAPAHALTSTAYQSGHEAGEVKIFRARTEWDI
jgi:DoxX-like family